MKSLVIATATILATVSISQSTLASSTDNIRRLLSTKECQNCNLTGAGLVLADLSGANLTGANLAGANLSRANLTGANLSGANLSGASFFGANLTGAKFNGAIFAGTDFRTAYLFNAEFKDVSLNNANFQGAVGIPLQAASHEQFYALGVAEAERGNQKQAIEYFSQAIAVKPDFAIAYLTRAITRYQALDREGAFLDAQMAQRLYKIQDDKNGIQTAQVFIKELQTPYNPRVTTGGSGSFVDILGSLGSLILQFLPF